VLRQHSDLRIQVRTLATVDLLHALRGGRIDAAFLSPPEPEDGLTVHVLAREPLLAVLPEGHRLANRVAIQARDLAAECQVRLTASAAPALSRCVAAFWAREGVDPVAGLEVDTPLAMLRLVGRGAGVAL